MLLDKYKPVVYTFIEQTKQQIPLLISTVLFFELYRTIDLLYQKMTQSSYEYDDEGHLWIGLRTI